MGPPIFIGGNAIWNNPQATPEQVASMGPPIFIGGNRFRIKNYALSITASMGPPIFIGGNRGIRS